jgi:uncharacterized protein YukE
MSDIITLDPKQAADTLSSMQNTVKTFLQEIEMIGEVLRLTAALTFSSPLGEVFEAAAEALTNIGNAVNAAVNAYSQAFVQVIETWKQTDMTASSDVSFDKPAFDGITISLNDAVKVEVQPSKVRDLLSKHEDHSSRMQTHFNTMDDGINNSSGYWIGESGNNTRNAWTKSVAPLNDEVQKILKTVGMNIETQLTDFMRRDASNYVH